jgi:ribosomal protein S12 methylthiotransferase
MELNSKKIHVITLGCEKNTVDSEALMKQLQANNLQLTRTSEFAETVVINTCGFIEDAKNQSLETILQAVKLKQEGKLKHIVVMGCLSERYAEELKKEIPDVDAYIGANKIEHVVTTLGGKYKYELLGERLLTTPRHYAYLKISEGCDHPCSFCAIPLMRGKHVSKPMERVVTEAQRLAALGVKELIVIAQDSTSYGLDLYGKRMLGNLLEKISKVDGIEWIRLMYAYPAKFPLDILEVFKSSGKLCRYLDLPVQHIADSVLKSMRRGISSRATRELIENIRREVPDIALRTTLIVGYPNEGEKEFQELLRFVQETKFDRLGVFTYSQEEGTTAFSLADPIPPQVKEERRSIIMDAQREISLAKNVELIGTTVRVLIDENDGSVARGRTERDAPEIDNEVMIENIHQCRVGEFLDVKITDAVEYDIYGTPALQPTAKVAVP